MNSSHHRASKVALVYDNSLIMISNDVAAEIFRSPSCLPRIPSEHMNILINWRKQSYQRMSSTYTSNEGNEDNLKINYEHIIKQSKCPTISVPHLPLPTSHPTNSPNTNPMPSSPANNSNHLIYRSQ